MNAGDCLLPFQFALTLRPRSNFVEGRISTPLEAHLAGLRSSNSDDSDRIPEIENCSEGKSVELEELSFEAMTLFSGILIYVGFP